MKKVRTLLIAVLALLLCLSACGGQPAAPAQEATPAPKTAAPTAQPKEASYYYGTWKLSKLSDGKKVILLEDAIANGGDPAMRDMTIVFNESGQFQFVTATGNWEPTETGVEINGQPLALQGDYLLCVLKDQGVILIFEKVSSSQEFIEATAAEEAPAEEPAEEAAEEAPAEEPVEEKSAPASGIRPEFKEAMDAYEAFYDEYCEFMANYTKNPTDLSLLSKYAQMLSRVEEMDKKFEAWESSDLNDEELKYYLDVVTRVEKKMIDLF